MIPIENIPRSGVLVISVYFKGYKDYYQNESRKELKEQVPIIDIQKNLEINLKPFQFSLLRRVDEEGDSKTRKGRSIGVIYSFSYSNMIPEKYKTLHKELENLLAKKKSKWSHFDIMVASRVGGV